MCNGLKTIYFNNRSSRWSKIPWNHLPLLYCYYCFELCILDHSQIGINYASVVAAIYFAISKCNVFAVWVNLFSTSQSHLSDFICIRLAENRMNRNWLFQEARCEGRNNDSHADSHLSVSHPTIQPSIHPDISTHPPIFARSCSRILSREEGPRSK